MTFERVLTSGEWLSIGLGVSNPFIDHLKSLLHLCTSSTIHLVGRLTLNDTWLDDMSSTARSPEPVPITPSLATLPSELLVEIAEHLAATYSLGSLASFNTVSHRVHDTTLSVLYRKLILVTRDPEGFEERDAVLTIEEGMPICEGWKYTK
jgi:hypothetical protein